jgi:hypothetical protein
VSTARVDSGVDISAWDVDDETTAKTEQVLEYPY